MFSVTKLATAFRSSKKMYLKLPKIMHYNSVIKSESSSTDVGSYQAETLILNRVKDIEETHKKLKTKPAYIFV